MDKFQDEWEWVLVWHGPFVKAVIVLDWMEFTIFLSYEEEAADIWGIGALDTV